MKHEASARVLIGMPREQVWDRLRDLSLAHNYVPGVTGCEITSSKQEGVGASRRVLRRRGGPMDETVTDWHEGQRIVLRLHCGEVPPMPFRRAQFTYRLENGGESHTALVTSLHFDMRWGRLGQWLHDRFLQRIFRSTIRDVAIAMKQFYETEKPVLPADMPALRAAARRSLA